MEIIEIALMECFLEGNDVCMDLDAILREYNVYRVPHLKCIYVYYKE